MNHWQWQPIETAPVNVPIMTKIDDYRGERNVQPLTYSSNLWWFTDKSMYVYYQPTHWRALTEAEARQEAGR